MSPILQTELDAQLELRAIQRLTRWYDYKPIKLPEMAAMDYLIADEQEVIAGVEIKTRKESPEQIKQYGKLILKWRKYEELLAIGEILNIPTYVLFAFENAEGQLSMLNIKNLHASDPKPQTPPRRKNYRGLATDEEPVIYFDWELLTEAVERNA